MEITAEELIYLAVIKQACRDYVEWKRKKDFRFSEVENFLLSIDFSKINGEWLIELLDSFALGDKKRYWRQDLAELYKVIGGYNYG